MTAVESQNNSAPNDWLYSPAANLVTFLSDEMMVAGLTESAFRISTTLPDILRTAQSEIRNARMRSLIAELASAAKDNAFLAQREVDDDMQRVRKHHLVAIWSAVETTTEHMLVNILRNIPGAELQILAHPVREGAKPPKVNDNQKATIANWRRSLRAAEIMECEIEMFSALGVDIQLRDTGSSRALSDLCGLRNAIVHNAGFVDQAFLQRCPWRNEAIGDRLHVSNEEVFRCCRGFCHKSRRSCRSERLRSLQADIPVASTVNCVGAAGMNARAKAPFRRSLAWVPDSRSSLRSDASSGMTMLRLLAANRERRHSRNLQV